MNKLTAEMKGEIQAKRLQAEINARIRNAKVDKPIPAEPKKSLKVLSEKPLNYYKDGVTRVSDWYWEYEERGIQQSSEPVYRPRR